MKIGKHDIDINFSTIETFDGEFKTPKGFWLEKDFRSKENDSIRGSESFNEWMWSNTIYRQAIMFGFRKWGVWIFITKYK